MLAAAACVFRVRDVGEPRASRAEVRSPEALSKA
jgi:maltose/moltooligosaccharide transporter